MWLLHHLHHHHYQDQVQLIVIIVEWNLTVGVAKNGPPKGRSWVKRRTQHKPSSLLRQWLHPQLQEALRNVGFGFTPKGSCKVVVVNVQTVYESTGNACVWGRSSSVWMTAARTCDKVGKVPPFGGTVWQSVSAILLKRWRNNDIWFNTVSAV
jgi:hypothetical protein